MLTTRTGRSSVKKRAHTSRCALRCGLEPLEIRRLLSTVVWSPGIDLPAPRGGAAAIVQADQSILIIGGGGSSASRLGAGTSAWTTAADTGYPLIAPAIELTNGGLLIYGRSGDGPVSEYYFPANADANQDTAPMNTARTLFASAADSLNRAFAIGGINGTGAPLASVERFNAAAGTWANVAALPTALSGAAAVNDGNGHILVFGGAAAGASATTTVYRYTVATDTWDTLAPMPTATTEAGAVLGADGMIYVVGGLDTTGAAQATVQTYDPTANAWTTNTSLPAAVSDEAVVSDPLGRIEVIGGNDATHHATATVTVSQYLNQPDAAPVITSTPITQISGDGSYTYQVTAAGNPQPTFSLTTAPAGMAIDPDSGMITWSPTPDQMGPQNVTVQATNRDGQESQSFAIQIAAPVITTTTLKPASANVAYSAQIASTGNPAVTFSLTAAPVGMTISPAGLLSWSPTPDEVGNQTVTVEAMNFAGQASQTYTVGVIGLAPTGLTATGASTTSIALAWNPATDPSGVSGYNVYERHFIHNPRGSGGTYHYSLIAGNVQGTAYTVGGLAAGTLGSNHTYVVTSVDAATGLESPRSVPASGTTWYAPDVYVFTINGADWSGPVAATVGTPIPQVQFAWYANPNPVFTLVSGPSGMSIDPNTGVITWTPAAADAGTVTAVFNATNPVGSQNMSITFNVAPDLQVAPIMTWPSLAPMVLGTPWDATQMNAVVTDATTGAVVDGTTTYTAIVPNTTVSITLIDPTWLGAGDWVVTASFVPTDTIDYTGVSATQTLAVSQATSATALQESSSTSIAGEPVTFTATVIPSSGWTPTGTIDFMDGATDLGSVYMDVTGAASLTINSLAVGDHAITAVYSGDSNTVGSSSASVTQSVSQAATTAVVAVAPSPSLYGQLVTFTAAVTGVAPSSGTPTGIVTFVDGVNAVGTATLDANGNATFSTSSLSIGAHSISAVYGGDDNYAGSAAAAVAHTVTKDATKAVVTAAPSPSVFGQSVTFTAAISPAAPGSGTLTGTVTFKDGTTTLGSGTLNNGVATFTTSSLSVTTHHITAVYSGDADFNTSTSASLSHIVQKAATTATVTSAPNPSVYGQSVTLSATVVANAPGSGTPTGSVTFKDGATTLGTATLIGGIATLKTTKLAVGAHNITIVYGGSSGYLSTTSAALTHVVDKASSIVTLTSSKNPATHSTSITFTATVKAVSPGAATPTGTITFMDGSAVLSTITLSSAVAKYATSTLSVGTHNITAVYSGDGNVLAGTSMALLQTLT